MFKVIESEEEFVLVASAGLLWVDREEGNGWEYYTYRAPPEWFRGLWIEAVENANSPNMTRKDWLPENFAVLVEE